MTIRSEFDRRYEEAWLLTRAVDDAVERKRLMAAHVYPSDDIDDALMMMDYHLENARNLNFDDPRDFSAKLHWLKRHDRRALYGRLADKYAVRGYVADQGLGHILNRCHGVFVDPMEIDDAVLPTTFVIKATHGPGMSIVCRDNDTFDWNGCRNELGRWLTTRPEERHGEWPYSLVGPRLMVEEFLPDGEQNGLSRYEIFCFDGVPKFLEARTLASGCGYRGFLSPDWHRLPFHYPDATPAGPAMKRPGQLPEMLTIAERLSRSLPFVRVDLFVWRGEIRFADLTLYPRGGNVRLVPAAWHLRVGGMLSLPVRSGAGARAEAARPPVNVPRGERSWGC